MVKLIEADTRHDAWIEGVKFLLENGPSLNLILAIGSPVSNGSLSIADRYIDKFLKDEKQLPMHTVAETIFPGWQYQKRGLRGVFEIYPNEEYPLMKKHRSISWGTYAYRLVRRQDAHGDLMNPLEQMIDKMKKEITMTGSKKSCYELGMTEGEYDLPLYSTAKDGKRRRGGPCLSHLSFKLIDREIHLTAFYRSHDYRYKVPGNLLGLARLQTCVARETGQGVGSMVVHSSYAFLNGAKARIRHLLQDIRTNQEQEYVANVVAH